MRNKIRFAMFGLLVAAGFALAPAAFARNHWNVGIGIGLPGVSLGYSNCHHCGWGGGYGDSLGVGYYGGGYGGYYGGGYAPAYYAPSYSYYEPAYYDYPSYGAVYYDRPVHRGYYSDRYERRSHHRNDYDRGSGRDYGHRAQYYDRSSGGYRH